MNQFYLNNIVGAPVSAAAGSVALRNAVMAYCKLASNPDLNVSPRIVLDKDPQLITFGDFYIGQLLEQIQDREERRMAYNIMRGAYPVEELFKMDENDLPMVDAAYKYNGQDATNIAIAYRHDGLLLTVAFIDDLKQDRLTFISTAAHTGDYPSTFEIDNLHGDDSNTAYIEQVLRQREGVAIDLFEVIRDSGYLYSTIEHDFRKQTPDIQRGISNGFRDAIEQGLIVPHAGVGNNVITPNSTLVRRETHTKVECLFEIRTSEPKVMRVIIAQDKGELFILDIKSKEEMQDGGVVQNKVLRAAEKRFRQMKKAL